LDLWLDIGIGGGELVLPLSYSAWLLIGIDYSDGMIQTAHNNLSASKVEMPVFSG
jgi:2-polyprenyl-3-methyl-5-hydroxy-6-metoxy-1,4-benzoquinol methylase